LLTVPKAGKSKMKLLRVGEDPLPGSKMAPSMCPHRIEEQTQPFQTLSWRHQLLEQKRLRKIEGGSSNTSTGFI
jgi:hypothetical protein